MKLPKNNLKSARFGIMLVDCMMYLAILSIVLFLAYALCDRAAGNSANLRRNANQIVETLRAGERWRDDIHSAVGAITIQNRNDGHSVIVPQELGDVTYVFAGTEVRRQFNGRDILLMKGVKSSSVHEEQREHVKAYRWEIELRSAAKAKTRPLFTFLAVPGAQ